MLDVQEQTALDNNLRTLWIFWAAMLGSLLIFLVVCHQLALTIGVAAPRVPVQLIGYVCYFLSAVGLVFAYFLRKNILSGRSVKPSAGSVADSRTSYLPRYISVVIVSLAMGESAGVYGLVLFFLGNGFQSLYIFIAISAVGLVIFRPSRDEVDELARKFNQDSIAMGEGNKGDASQEQSTHSGDVSLISRHKYIIESDGGDRREQYKVKDEAGNTLCVAKRQGRLFKTLALAGLFFMGFPLLFVTSGDSVLKFIGLSIVVTGVPALVFILLKPKHLLVYQSDNENDPMLRIMHCKLYRLFTGTYLIESATGERIGHLCINHVLTYFRGKMKCYRPDGSLLCTIIEPLAVSTVLWRIVSLFLRSTHDFADNFNVFEPTESRVIGKFSRKMIELSPEAGIDGRICLAMGLMIRAELWLV